MKKSAKKIVLLGVLLSLAKMGFAETSYSSSSQTLKTPIQIMVR